MRLSLRRELLLVLARHVVDGLELLRGVALPHGSSMLSGVERGLRLSLEVREHLLSEEFRGTLGVLRVGPVVAHLQQASEAARLAPTAAGPDFGPVQRYR